MSDEPGEPEEWGPTGSLIERLKQWSLWLSDGGKSASQMSNDIDEAIAILERRDDETSLGEPAD